MKTPGKIASVAFLFASVCITGCAKNPPQPNKSFNDIPTPAGVVTHDDIRAADMEYHINPNTGICSQTYRVNDRYGLPIVFDIEIVPATPDVLKLVDPKDLETMRKNGVEPVRYPFAHPPAPGPQ